MSFKFSKPMDWRKRFGVGRRGFLQWFPIKKEGESHQNTNKGKDARSSPAMSGRLPRLDGGRRRLRWAGGRAGGLYSHADVRHRRRRTLPRGGLHAARAVPGRSGGAARPLRADGRRHHGDHRLPVHGLRSAQRPLLGHRQSGLCKKSALDAAGEDPELLLF